MIQVTVEYFAVFRERAGLAAEQVTTKGDTAHALFEQVATAHGFSDPQSRCKVAINDELVDWDSEISEGDRVLFFPPVAGG